MSKRLSLVLAAVIAALSGAASAMEVELVPDVVPGTVEKAGLDGVQQWLAKHKSKKGDFYDINFDTDCLQVAEGTNKTICVIDTVDHPHMAMATCTYPGCDIAGEMKELAALHSAGVHTVPYDPHTVVHATCGKKSGYCPAFFVRWIDHSAHVLMGDIKSGGAKKIFGCFAGDDEKLNVLEADIRGMIKFEETVHFVWDLQFLVEPATGHAWVFDPQDSTGNDARIAPRDELNTMITWIDELRLADKPLAPTVKLAKKKTSFGSCLLSFFRGLGKKR